MMVSRQSGFTIIETMLFLAISGLLAAAILVGTGASLGRQRYKDSVRSLQSFLQQQYSEVSNVINDGASSACGVPTRGRSNCVVMGKYITTSGSTFRVRRVIGTIPASGGATLDDFQAINAYSISTTGTVSTYDMDWGTSVVRQGTTTPFQLSMLIIKAPESGTLHTFIDTTSSSIAPLALTATPPSPPASLNNSARLCVESSGLVAGTKMAVLINSGASGASDVTMSGDSDSGC